MKRLLAILLVVCILSICLVSCGGNKPAETTENPQGNQGTTEATSRWDNVSFNGTTLNVNLNEHILPAVIEVGTNHSNKFIVGPDDYTSDAVQNAVYDRNNKVLRTLGIDVNYSYDGSASDNILPVIDAWVLAASEDSPDIAVTKNYALIRAALAGNLRNVLDTTEENYFDFTDPHWYYDFMEATSLSRDKIYALSSDYFIDEFRMAFVTLVNNDLYNEIFANEGGIDSLYELIEAGDWDYDEMMRTAEMAYVDAGTVGLQDAEDIFGISAYATMANRSMFYSSGLDIFNYDENGTPSYVTDITVLHDYTDILLRLFNQDCVFYTTKGGKDTTTFLAGNALYAVGQYLLMLEGSAIQNMGSGQSVSVIPYPKYDKASEYQTLVSDSACGGAILKSTTDFSAATAFIQMMTEESGEMYKQYYEVALKYKLSSGSGQLKLLDILKNSITSPTAFLYDNYCARTLGTSTEFRTIYDIINESITNNSNTLTSTWESQVNSMQGQLETAVATFKALD